NAVQNPRVQNIRNQNGLISVPGNANQNLNGNDNLVAVRAERNEAGHNGNQIRWYNCKPPVYDLDGATEVHEYENCYDNEIFNMFTQEKHYTELLEPIHEPLQVPQNDNNVTSEVTSIEHSGETVEQHPANVEKTRALYDSLYQNLAIEVEKVNSVNRKLKETNADLTTKLARFKNQEKCDECKYDKISYDKAYKDMHQKIERLQAQLGDLKGKSKDISCVSDTLNPLSQKFENENIELEFQVLNYARENSHLKTTYKNLFESIYASRAQTKTIIASLQHKLQNTIYENAKLRAQLFKKECLGLILLRLLGKKKLVPNNVSASVRTKPIIVSQPPVITKKDVNSDSNGLSSTEYTTLRPEGHSLGAIQRMIGSPLRLRVVEARIKILK
nr:hypothetical protein [Tanacetum cinerariifolium]